MLKNYLKIAFRVITRQKLFAAINIFGLSVGLASAMLLFFYVNYEMSYDKSFTKSDRIYRVNININVDNNRKLAAVTPNRLGTTLLEELTEVEKYVRTLGASLFNKAVIQRGEDYFIEENLFYADSTMFDLFDVEILEGNKAELLNSPAKVVLSKSAAEKFFRDETAIGQTQIFAEEILEVTGIFEDFPSNYHMHPEIIISFST